jgi:hypothetical protein
MSDRKPLRVRVSYTRFRNARGSGTWFWSVEPRDRIPHGMLGAKRTASEAADEGRMALLMLFAARRSDIVRRGNSIEVCPWCGDPCEYEERVSSMGVSCNYLCESCGADEGDSA